MRIVLCGCTRYTRPAGEVCAMRIVLCVLCYAYCAMRMHSIHAAGGRGMCYAYCTMRVVLCVLCYADALDTRGRRERYVLCVLYYACCAMRIVLCGCTRYTRPAGEVCAM